jgi:hypothetical protein
VPELRPPPLPVEGGERHEKIGERVVLAAEEVGEAGGVFACGRHDRMVARVSETSWDARIPVLARDLDEPSRTPREVPRHPSRSAWAPRARLWVAIL